MVPWPAPAISDMGPTWPNTAPGRPLVHTLHCIGSGFFAWWGFVRSYSMVYAGSFGCWSSPWRSHLPETGGHFLPVLRLITEIQTENGPGRARNMPRNGLIPVACSGVACSGGRASISAKQPSLKQCLGESKIQSERGVGHLPGNHCSNRSEFGAAT